MLFLDTYPEILTRFPEGRFSLSLWREYAASIAEELPDKIEQDVSSFDFLQIGLPVVQAALQQQEKLTQAHESFLLAVRGLEVNLARLFPDMPDAIVLFYLGLCDSAGYATTLAEKPAVLLGVEKIIELGWCDENAMKGLLYHELGHLWQLSLRSVPSQNLPQERWLWQLYSEGVAMAFEQEVCGNPLTFHQDQNGWLNWCLQQESCLKREFYRRILKNESAQDFFGDWNNYQGHSDVGYFLGSRFIRFLMRDRSLREAALLPLPCLLPELENWVQSPTFP